MMHNDSKMINFMCGENIGGPLMLACMSEGSDMPLACVMMNMGMNNPCMEFSVMCDPNMGMMMTMPTAGSMMPMSGSPMPMGHMMMPMSGSGSSSMMASCMCPMAMGGCCNGNCSSMGNDGHAMGMRGNSMGMHSMSNSGMHGMMGPMMRMAGPMMMGSGRNMMNEGMRNRMCMMMGRQDMMNTCKLVIVKLDSMSAGMDMSNMDALCNALKMARPLWQCRLEHMRGCATVMISRNPMTNEVCAMENASGRGSMMECGEQRMCGMLTMMMPMPMRSKL